MAAITTAAVVGTAAAYSAKKQADAAKGAAKKQAEGVRNAQEETRRYREEALGYINPAFEQGRADIQSGYESATNALSPLSQYYQPLLQEQQNLLGLGGEDAYQQALSRISDPLQAEQEQAFLRNNAALGGVGGNVLSALAEQTRARTEANIGNRLNQLGMVASPSLSALQQLAQYNVNQGQTLGQLSQNQGQIQANTAIGAGSELAQLAQNLGTARAGYDAYRAQNPHWLSQGIQSGVGAYFGGGLGSMFGGGSDGGLGQMVGGSGFGGSMGGGIGMSPPPARPRF